MSQSASTVNLLEGVFRELLARKIPLGMRDYLDALRALDLGYGQNTRDELRGLCHTLWARNDIDRRAIDIAFSLVGRTPDGDADALKLNRAFSGIDETAPSGPSATTSATQKAQEGDMRATEASLAKASRTGVTFGPKDGGIPLTPLAASTASRENYVLSPQTLVSKRQLAVLWRRLRRLSRRGIPTELDIQETIRMQCRQGVLSRAMLRPPRRNTAGLVILADASASMAPWRPFLQTLLDSFSHSKLHTFDLLYFSNFPRKWLFRTPSLNDRIKFDDVTRQYAGLPLMVISDAGAARGQFSPRRVAQTTEFVALANQHFRPIVWLNPMPRVRWRGTSADALTDHPKLTVLPLEKNTLTRAVDVLRGERTE